MMEEERIEGKGNGCFKSILGACRSDVIAVGKRRSMSQNGMVNCSHGM